MRNQDTLSTERAMRKKGVEVIRCKKCSKELKQFRSFIPDLGEVCMNCYIKYAQETEDLKNK